MCVHVEASDEASHEGRGDEKVKAIAEIDKHVVGPVLDALKKHGDWRIMISPDHPTFLRTKVHTHGNVPVAMAGTGITADEFKAYGDTNAANSKLAFDEGWRSDALVHRKKLNHQDTKDTKAESSRLDFSSCPSCLCGELARLDSESTSMSLIVQKFGGTSVANAEKIRAAARRAIRAQQEGNQVVMVVSAMGHQTDILVDLAKQITDDPSGREMDMLLSTGEQVSVALMAMAIHSLGRQGREPHRRPDRHPHR